jgi:hypothetical protein
MSFTTIPLDEAPSGLPPEGDEGGESEPLGVPEADPDREGVPERGEDAMPGIATDGEPPSSG